MNKALLDTDIYSEVLKAVDPNVARNATAYRQAQGVFDIIKRHGNGISSRF